MPTYKELRLRQTKLQREIFMNALMGRDVLALEEELDIVMTELSRRPSFATSLTMEREKAGLSKAELSRRSGIALSSISQFESDKQVPSKYAFGKLQSVLPGLMNPHE